MTSRVCDACGDDFETLTELRLHEKDDCPGRETFGEINPDSQDAGGEIAEGLLTCRGCGSLNPDADYDQTASFDGEDYHLIVEFTCRFCGSDTENRSVMTGIDPSDLEDLPTELRPVETDGGSIQPNGDETGARSVDDTDRERIGVLVHNDGLSDEEKVALVFALGRDTPFHAERRTDMRVDVFRSEDTEAGKDGERR